MEWILNNNLFIKQEIYEQEKFIKEMKKKNSNWKYQTLNAKLD